MSTPTASTASASSPQHNEGEKAGIINALGNAFKGNGDDLTPEQMAKLLQQNMPHLTELFTQGKLTATQIMTLKEYTNSVRQPNGSTPTTNKTSTPVDGSSAPAPTPAASSSAIPAQTPQVSSAAFFEKAPTFPTDTLNITNPGPVAWGPSTAAQTRPTLTGGIASGRVSGTPSQIARPEEMHAFTIDDTARASSSRRKNTPGDQSMRRSIQELVASVDPNVKIESEVEELLLNIADEFIDSVTNFGCRLAKHRGGDALEVRDLQLHLERNHNIRIPGFASDETRISLSQSSVPAPLPPTAANTKSGAGAKGAGGAKKGNTGGGTGMTLRSHRLQQVANSKREGKLI